MTYQDILYEKRDGVATIAIVRPQVLNAFRGQTVEEMLAAFADAAEDEAVGGVALSPTALAVAKRSFNADSENIRTEQARGGVRASFEERRPNFRRL